ncbi:glycoside hydrolase family 25 protein [Piedraia hortae CBS 480.64]|uniref:N,O-diacetylmuramidase n=1 Tax=Piedraia hortae CBS 480.64 TaxID=1314780 RepID=A0A6A7C2W6_9PEZI|nr:glycoside hydrolase family 25 protein [Piedraia hortae CBS 480.64]
MKYSIFTPFFLATALAAPTPVEVDDLSEEGNTTLVERASVQGFDVSSFQPNVNFASAHSGGLQFVYIKATEGTTYRSSSFDKQYTDATKAGFIRGSYHFAHGSEDPVAQAQFFVKHGGGWTADGITLPGALDLEGTSSSRCNGITVSWVKKFSDEYHSLTKRYPVLYINKSWWNECLGGSTAFKDTNPLWLASWTSSLPSLPGGWSKVTFWQTNDKNKFGGDSDVFPAGLAALKGFAKAG